MEISEVRVKLTSSQSDRVRAFCSVTFDGEFVVRDIKVIEGTNGLFVAMPSRKIADHCPKCRGKNHLRARHCNECGTKLRDNRAPRNGSGRSKLHADIAHPINMACRERLQIAILEEFHAELGRSQQPGYQPAVSDEEVAADTAPTRDRPKQEADTRTEEQYDNGAEYAALIAELREGGSKREDRSRREDRPSPSEEPAKDQQPEQQEPAEAVPPQEEPSEAEESKPAESETEREFGKGIF